MEAKTNPVNPMSLVRLVSDLGGASALPLIVITQRRFERAERAKMEVSLKMTCGPIEFSYWISKPHPISYYSSPDIESNRFVLIVDDFSKRLPFCFRKTGVSVGVFRGETIISTCIKSRLIAFVRSDGAVAVHRRKTVLMEESFFIPFDRALT